MHKNGDAHPSLSVKDGFCHAGCEYRDIVAALERRGILPRSGR
jgi:hypothetical protein